MTRRLRPAIVSVLIPLVALMALTCILGRADSASLEPALAAPLDAAPTVTEVDPVSATNDRDTPIVITGAGFAAVLSGTQVVTPPTVYLNDTSLGDAGWVSTTTLTTTVPAGFQIGIYTVTVENPDAQSGSLPNGLVVHNPVPTVESVDPVSGTYGQPLTLTIVGANFIATPTVSLDEIPCSLVHQISSTTLTATLPTGLVPGVYDLGVSNPGPGSPQGALADAFSLYSPTPVVTAVEPTAAPNDLDTQVVITGSNFAPTPTVSLAAAAPLEQVTWISTSRLIAFVPWGMDEGVYDLTVTNPDPGAASDTLLDAFTVTQVFNVWTTGGPYGGEIWNVTLHPVTPTRVYAAAQNSGLFSSDDAADQWQLALLASPVHRASASFDAALDDVIYFAVTGSDATLRTQDGGISWEHIAVPNPFLHEFNLVAHPITSGVVYATANAPMGNLIDPGENGGIYRSTNWGDDWITITTGLTDTHVTALAFHPDDPDLMLAGTRNGHIFTSTNGGDGWHWAAQPNTHIERLYFNPTGTHEAWAVTASPVTHVDPPLLYRSIGADLSSWEPITDAKMYSLVFHPTISNTMWASGGSGYVSTDGGDTWSALAAGPPGEVMDMAVDPTNPTVLYAGTRHYGVFKSADSGNKWTRSNQGLAGVVPDYMALSPDDPYEVYAYAHSMGLLKSSNGGGFWRSLALLRNVGGGAQDPLAVDPCTPTRVYLGDAWQATYSRTLPSVQISEDGGETWRVVTWTVPGMPAGWSGETLAVAPHPTVPGQILAGVSFFPPDREGPALGGLYSSTTYGEEWVELDITLPISGVTGLAYAPSNPAVIYAGTGGTGLLRSANGGVDWDVITSTLWSAQSIDAIAIHPEDPDQIYVSESGAVYVSDDAGSTWTDMEVPAYIQSLLFAPSEPPILYAAGNGGVYRNTGGQTWQQVPGVPREADARSLAAGRDGERVVVYIGSSAGTMPPETQIAGPLGPADAQVPGLGGLMDGGVYRRTTRIHWVYLPLVLRVHTQ
jgi:photosystem II stability/assembly factor-like uncharacterized protein